jgi:hypothetical protein
MDVEFLHDVLAVCFDGFHAEMHPVGNLGSAVALRQELEDLPLPGRQRGKGRTVALMQQLDVVADDFFGNRRAQVGLVVENYSDSRSV